MVLVVFVFLPVAIAVAGIMVWGAFRQLFMVARGFIRLLLKDGQAAHG